MSDADKVIFPTSDPTPIFEHFRGSYATELLTAAVSHFGVFGTLAKGPLTFVQLGETLKLQPRPLNVLITALRAMSLIAKRNDRYELTPMASEHLVPGEKFDVGNYISLAAQSPGVLNMVERLRTNRPANADNDSGAAFIYRDGLTSAMEQADSARHFTLALAGRAKNVAPHLAAKLDLHDAKCVLDVAGGTGIYAFAMLQRFPKLRAVILDRPEVLTIAREEATAMNVLDRVEFASADMFTDPLPAADVILLSNVLHDWDVPECRTLVKRCVAALPAGGRLLIHDVFLNDALDGPLPIALYSAALFTLTEGRAYSAGEYAGWMRDAGLQVGRVEPTFIHCGVLEGRKA